MNQSETNYNYQLNSSAQEALNILNNSIDNGEFLALAIVGIGGIGKTSLFNYLSKYVKDQGHWSLYVSARRSSSFEEMIKAVSRKIDEFSSRTKFLNPEQKIELGIYMKDVYEERTSSSDLALIKGIQYLLDNINKKTSFILMIDDLDSSPDDSRYSNFIRNLSELKLGRLKLLLASRSYDFFHRVDPRNLRSIQLNSLSQAESKQLLTKILSGTNLAENAQQTIINFAEGNPLLLTLLARNFQYSGPKDLSLFKSDNISSLLKDSIDSAIKSLPLIENQLRNILHLIAILEKIEFNALSELIHVSKEELWNLLDKLEQLGFISPIEDKQPSTVINFGHIIFQQYFTESLRNSYNINYNELQFGAEEAERDKQLKGSLVKSPWLLSLFEGNRSIVLGDRGSGKSALFRLLVEENMITNPEKGDINQIILSDSNPSSFVQRMITHDTNASSAEKFKAIWLSFVAAQLSKWYIDTQSKLATVDKSILKDCKRITNMVGWAHKLASVKPFKRRLAQLIRFVSMNVTLKIGPVTVEPSTKSKGSNSFGSQIDLEQFLSKFDHLLQNSNQFCKIIVDRIDEIYKYQRADQEALVQGLFLAESYLSHFNNTNVIILLRTDLFEIYDLQEKNKFQSRMITIDWTVQDIILAMLRRICSNELLKRLLTDLGVDMKFEGIHRTAALQVFFPVLIEDLRFEDWLIDAMKNARNRVSPRQIILFLNASRDAMQHNQKSIGSPFPIFSLKAINSAMTKLSELCHDEVVSDFRIATNFVRNCRAGQLFEFKLEDVKDLFDLSEGSIIEQVERLERLGYLARVVVRNKNGNLSHNFKIPNLFTRCWLRKA